MEGAGCTISQLLQEEHNEEVCRKSAVNRWSREGKGPSFLCISLGKSISDSSSANPCFV